MKFTTWVPAFPLNNSGTSRFQGFRFLAGFKERTQNTTTCGYDKMNVVPESMMSFPNVSIGNPEPSATIAPGCMKFTTWVPAFPLNNSGTSRFQGFRFLAGFPLFRIPLRGGFQRAEQRANTKREDVPAEAAAQAGTQACGNDNSSPRRQDFGPDGTNAL